MISYLKTNFQRVAFLTFSYFHNLFFLVLNLLPFFIRNLIFKICFKKFGRGNQIDYRTYFRYMRRIMISNDVSINRGTEFFTSANLNNNIIIKDHVRIAPNVKFYGAGHNYTFLDLPDTAGDITIEKHVWICANAIILQGTTVGEGSIVSANSVVTKDVPPYSVVAGIPAKVVRKREISDN